MAIREILQDGDPILREAADVVTDPLSGSIGEVIQDLKDTLEKDDLNVALAAPQIGVRLRIFVSRVADPGESRGKFGEMKIYINPVIERFSDAKEIRDEGCASVGRSCLFGPVERSKRVVMKALDEKVNEVQLKLEGFAARVVQHEVDHLDGVLFTDKLVEGGELVERE